jgi:hypothetical protein
MKRGDTNTKMSIYPGGGNYCPKTNKGGTDPMIKTVNMHTHRGYGRYSPPVPIKLWILITNRQSFHCHLFTAIAICFSFKKSDSVCKYCYMPGWVSLLFTDSRNSTKIYLEFAARTPQIAGPSNCRLCKTKCKQIILYGQIMLSGVGAYFELYLCIYRSKLIRL